MNAPVIIAHGSSSARGIAHAVRMGRRGVVSELLPTIARELGTRAALGVDSAKLARRLLHDP